MKYLVSGIDSMFLSADLVWHRATRESADLLTSQKIRKSGGAWRLGAIEVIEVKVGRGKVRSFGKVIPFGEFAPSKSSEKATKREGLGSGGFTPADGLIGT